MFSYWKPTAENRYVYGKAKHCHTYFIIYLHVISQNNHSLILFIEHLLLWELLSSCLAPTDMTKWFATFANIFRLESRRLMSKSWVAFFIITSDIFWSVCQAQKPTLFLGSFLPDLHGGPRQPWLGWESKLRSLAKSSHVTQAWQSQLSFQGMWNCDWEPASQSPWVAVEGMRGYSCFLPQKKLLCKERECSKNKTAETRGKDKELMAFQVQILAHSQKPAHSWPWDQREVPVSQAPCFSSFP